MGNLLTGFILGFREGLEAFLMVVILLRFLKRSMHKELIKSVWQGTAAGVVLSLIFGGLLFVIASQMGRMEQYAKLWESGSSLFALIFITTFIVWMIKHGSDMVGSVEEDASARMTSTGIFSLAALMVAREGVEISVFTFAGEYSFFSIISGVGLALILTVLIYYSLVRVDLKTIFTITMFYLILQAGFLLGYGIHEGLSALKDLGYLAESSPVFIKAYNLSGGIFDHKIGFIGLPLYVLLGWYSKPEFLQLTAQYTYTGFLLYFWYLTRRRSAAVEAAA